MFQCLSDHIVTQRWDDTVMHYVSMCVSIQLIKYRYIDVSLCIDYNIKGFL